MKLKIIILFSFFSIYAYCQDVGTMGIQSKIVFSYDDSGNQIERKFSAVVGGLKQSEEPEAALATIFEEKIKVYPNPTKGVFYIEWEKEVAQYISLVEILSSDAVIQSGRTESSVNKLNIDLTLKQSGIYFVRFTFTDGSVVSKKVIKL